jgi:hypothetical protein
MPSMDWPTADAKKNIRHQRIGDSIQTRWNKARAQNLRNLKIPPKKKNYIDAWMVYHPILGQWLDPLQRGLFQICQGKP